MTEIQPFVFPTTGQTVRTVIVDNEPWFVANDVCAVLGLGNPAQTVSALDDDEKDQLPTSIISNDAGREPGEMAPLRPWIISEAGLYSLVLRSRKAQAKVFKRWVTHEVLPAIRKTGSYSLPMEPMDELEIAERYVQAIKDRRAAEERADRAEFQVLELAPAARAWDELSESAGDYSVREAAQILDRDPRIDTGQKRLFEYLRSIGWLDRHNTPYQAQVSLGRLSLRVRSYEHPNRDELVATQQVRITAKGLGELHRRLGGGADVVALASEEVAA